MYISNWHYTSLYEVCPEEMTVGMSIPIMQVLWHYLVVKCSKSIWIDANMYIM